ncbi:hypothetical protein OEZ86_008418 [Tetradesmus obliquus]|nr:hypothetical protein OEZ86_008418 [Tetradesmus obliquus]
MVKSNILEAWGKVLHAAGAVVASTGVATAPLDFGATAAAGVVSVTTGYSSEAYAKARPGGAVKVDKSAFEERPDRDSKQH